MNQKIFDAGIVIIAVLVGVALGLLLSWALIDQGEVSSVRWNGAELNYQQAVMSSGLQIEGVLEYE